MSNVNRAETIKAAVRKICLYVAISVRNLQLYLFAKLFA